MRKEKIKGLTGTFVLHLILIIGLLFIAIKRPIKEEEGGVPVVLGDALMAQGDADPYTMTDVDVTDEPMINSSEATPLASQPSESVNDIITQKEEKSIEVEEKKNTVKETVKKKEVSKTKPTNDIKKDTPKPKEKSEAEKRAEAERLAVEKKAAEERAAAQQAASKIAGAFGKGSKMGSKGNGTAGEGIEGSPTGNSDIGKTTGVGGYGTFDLNGRSLGSGGLPRPVYNVQDEGRVVVTIVVNPAGQVISTSINKRTNTVNPSLRKAAEDAAKKARFNNVDGVNNQSGTITYYFKLR